MESKELLDIGQLFDNVGGDDALVDLLLERMSLDLPVRMEAIRAAVQAGDADAAHHATHPLKGALASIRAPQATRIATQADDAARQGDLATLKECLAPLDSAAAQLQAVIGERLRARAAR